MATIGLAVWSLPCYSRDVRQARGTEAGSTEPNPDRENSWKGQLRLTGVAKGNRCSQKEPASEPSKARMAEGTNCSLRLNPLRGHAAATADTTTGISKDGRDTVTA